MKKVGILIALLFIFGCAKGQEKRAINCTNVPCGNTATGEDPFDVGAKEGTAILDEIQRSDDNKLRWAAITLSSDSKNPDDLKMRLIKNVRFDMEISPNLGHIIFSKANLKQAFEIAARRGEKGSLCPEYTIKVTEASSSHAIIRKICRKFNYQPGKHVMAVDYYLYDSESSTMRNIWSSSVGKNSSLPEAKPTPSVKKINNGYRFDWAGLFPSDNKPSKMEIHNTYLRKKNKAGETILLCTDVSAPIGEGVENEMCEGGVLPKASPR